MNKRVKKLTIMALLLALGLVLSVIEMFIPFNYLPGVKLGLGNIATLVAIVMFGFYEGLFIAVARTAVILLLGGSPMSFVLAVSGGILATTVMYLLYRTVGKRFSIVGISIAGAVVHNIGQISALIIFYTKNPATASYLPVLMFSGIIMGTLTGLCTGQVLRVVPKNDVARKLP